MNSEATERLRKWATTGDGRDIDDVALVVLAELDMAMAELNRLKAFVADHRARAKLFIVPQMMGGDVVGHVTLAAVPATFMEDPEPTP